MKLLLHKINQGIILCILYLFYHINFYFYYINSGIPSSGMKQKELKVEDALVYLDQVSNIDIIDFILIITYIDRLKLSLQRSHIFTMTFSKL